MEVVEVLRLRCGLMRGTVLEKNCQVKRLSCVLRRENQGERYAGCRMVAKVMGVE